jgi:cytochrome c peroxidase
MELKDWMNSINFTKNNLLEENTDIMREYPPFIINKCLSHHIDSILYVNEMNRYHFLDKDMQYLFYLNSLRKRKRYSPWIHKDKIKDLENVKKYYGYSDEKARQALQILRKDQLAFIKSKFETGGTK